MEKQMRKFYQIEWQGITFESFFSVSSTDLADAKFYAAFYEEFFKWHTTWKDIDPRWIATKDRVVRLIAERIQDHDRCLSIGCGLGYIESRLLSEHKCDLHVTETSVTPLKWLVPIFPPDRLHIGFFPGCMPSENNYDLIYLSGVDYCFDQESWEQFLIAVRNKLRGNGRCLVVSGALQQESGKATLRAIVADLLVKFGIRKRGQFWGYLRTRNDYRTAMTAAGFAKQQEGTLADGTYWIEGRVGG